MRLSLLPLLLLALGLAPACKQGENERCQIDDDCSSGLICSDSQHICVPVGGATPDGQMATDAHIDSPDDAPVDAILDGTAVDATSD